MGCDCKKGIINLERKYGDNGVTDEPKTNFFVKILQILLQIPMAILFGTIIIVMFVPMLLYVVFCMMFGIQAQFKVMNLNRWIEKLKYNEDD